MRTKDKLAQSVIDLLETHRLDELTVRKITEHAGVTRQVFYRYFHTRDDLIRWIYSRNFAEAFKPDQLIRWNDMAVEILRAIEGEKDLYRHLAGRDDDSTLTGIMEEYTAQLYNRMILLGTGREPDEEMKLLLQIHIFGGIRMAARWMESGMTRSAEEMRDLFLEAMPLKIRRALTEHTVAAKDLFDPNTK